MIAILVAGIVSGFVMGCIGMGGGAFLVPLLLFSGLTIQEATAIVLFTQVIPQTLPALYIYAQHSILPWREGVVVTLGSFLGVTLGALLVTRGHIKTQHLHMAAAVSLTLIALVVLHRACSM